MFQWSKKVVKSVTFNPGVADESLLGLVESHLDNNPHLTFSDLCKEALWQSLCVPESVRPGGKPTATATGTPTSPTASPQFELQIIQLQRQLADLEGRFFAKESNRLAEMERQISQLSQQVAQLAMMVNYAPVYQSPSTPVPAAEVVHTNKSTPTPPQEVDPLLNRLSQFLDDF